MTQPRSGRDGSVEVVDVQVAPPAAGADAALVRVSGRFTEGGPDSRSAPFLIVGGERITALSGFEERGDPDDPRWQSTFSVPERLRPGLSESIVFASGAVRIDLPPVAREAAKAAERVEPDDLAEHRARRAEAASEAQAHRAAEAEQTLSALEAERARLELGLEQAASERAELETALAERERELRAARQRAYAEQRLRQEASDDASKRMHHAEDEVLELRRRVERAEGRAGEASSELEALRRRAAEAQQQALLRETEATRERTPRPPAPALPRSEALAGAERQVGEAREMVAFVQERLERERAAAAADTDRRLETQRAELEASTARMQERAAELERDLRGARADHAVVQGEVQERSSVQRRIERELATLRGEVGRLQLEAEAQARERHAAERMVAELTSSADAVRTQLAALESERRTAATMSRQAQELLEHSRTETAELRAELDQSMRARDAAVAARERDQADFEDQRADFQRQREEFERQRADFERRLLQVAERAQEEAQRELVPLRQRAEDLRESLEQATIGLRPRLEAERRARLKAETALEEQTERTRILEAEVAERDLVQGRIQGALDELREQLGAVVADEQRTRASGGAVLDLVGQANEALAEAEQRIAEVQAAAHEVRGELEREREDRAASEAVLRGQAERERQAYERRLTLLHRRLDPAEAEAGAAEVAQPPAESEPAWTQQPRANSEPAHAPPEDIAESDVAPAADSPPHAEAPEPPTFEEAERRVEDLLTGLRERLRALEERAEVELGSEAIGARPAVEPDHPAAETPTAATVAVEPTARTPGDAPATQPGGPAIVRPGVPVAAAAAGAWVGPALGKLAATDPAGAAQLAIELVPAQAAAIGLAFDADVVLAGLGAWRVTAESEGGGSIAIDEPRARRDVHFRLTTEPAAFVKLIAGERRRRGRPRIKVQGSRRAARRLRGLTRAPVGLREAFRRGAEIDAQLAWAAVATAIDAEETTGARFTVAFRSDGDSRPFFVAVADGAAVSVGADAGPEPSVATVTGSQRALVARLAGEAPNAGEEAAIAGDREAVHTLEVWAARAQGLAG